MTTDPELKIRTWNRAATRIYGWTRGEVVGRSTADVLGTVWEDPDEREESRHELLSRGVWAGEVVQRRRDGEPIRVWSTVSLTRAPGGTVDGILAVNRDITGEWEAARALDLARAHLVYARHLESVGSLTEACAPVAQGHATALVDAVAAAAAMLPDHHPPRGALDAAFRAAQLLQQDVRRLAERVPPQGPVHDVIDLAQILAEMEPTLRVCANVDVVSSTERLWVRGDRVRMEHLLVNLVQGPRRVSLRLRGDVATLYLSAAGALVDWPLVRALARGLGGEVVDETVVLPRSSPPFIAEAGREPLRVAILEDHEVLRDAAARLARSLGHDVVEQEEAQLALACRGSAARARPHLPVVELLDDNAGLKAPEAIEEAIDAALARVN